MDNKLIREELKKRNMSVLDLSRKSELGYATCYDILSGKIDNPKIKTLHKIATVLELSIDKIILGGEKNEKTGDNKN